MTVRRTQFFPVQDTMVELRQFARPINLTTNANRNPVIDKHTDHREVMIIFKTTISE
jgi:hypothetical protein